MSMYLKRLESVGFKSFAERIKIEFVPGVTAVVGPNGSGKSNITDAIRWVLGEQSVKSLRGQKMEDIIFQGSDTRNRLNVAEVTLVLDNSDHTLPLDYDEVSVTRRVYRSGESEFYINQQSCRLKDIIDLFMDSGLGRDAFSIISQGKVEEVLSSKPEDRRTIFEDAAGVLKYKQRKQKAEFKLQETEENLNRVNDIIYENEQQLEPLFKQAEKAKTYNQLKEQLKKEEISLIITEIEGLHREWQSLLKAIEADQLKDIEMKTELRQKEAELESIRHQIADLDQEIDSLQAQLLKATQELEQSEGKKQLLEERTKHLSENREQLLEQKQQLEKQIQAITEELKIQEKTLFEMRTSRQQTKESLDLLEVKLKQDQAELTDLIEDLKSEYIEQLNRQAAKRNERQSLEQQLQQIDVKQASQSQRITQLTIERADFIKQKESLTEQWRTEKARYEEALEQYRTLQTDIDQKRQQLEEDKNKLNQGYQIITKLKSRQEMLEEMKEAFHGFFQGVKAILKARDQKVLKHIHGAVVELIDVPKEYMLALETVLGAQAQHVVVADDHAAREAIYWLKKTNQGRATFLPLQSIEPRFIPNALIQQIESHPGYVGIAADLVTYDSAYESIIRYLMGHVIIAENLEAANEIAVVLQRRYRIVTLEGDMINPGGSMSGGAVKQQQSLFSRERELQELTEKVADYEKRMAQFQTEMKMKQDELAQQEQDLEVQAELLTKVEQEIQRLEAEQRQLDIHIQTLTDQIDLYEHDLQQLQIDQKSLESQQKMVIKEINAIEAELTKTQTQIDALTAEQVTFKENRDQLENDYHRHRVILAEQEERLRSQTEKTNQLKQQLVELNNQYKHVNQLIAELNDAEQNHEKVEWIEQKIQEKRVETETLTKKIEACRLSRIEKNQFIQDEERELKDIQRQHEQFLKALQEKEVKANRLDVELENRLNHLQTEYIMTYEKACQLYEKTTQINETRQMVEHLKQQIKQLGHVNLGAIEEYDRIKARYDFLIKQRDDLVKAKDMLYDIIEEMDEEMKKAFHDTFKQIKEEFTVVFKELFNGGHAELNLSDPKDLLNTGVEIIAQPPGKKLQNLSLLSGGEKALTAIALLFAILRVRPVPFCILDEAESALDEANVIRFARYIKQHSDQTQFIVITHRKGTMEEADVLYGVTMQESGVSRLVSVKLEDSLALVNT